jgi:hypothetical protein
MNINCVCENINPSFMLLDLNFFSLSIFTSCAHAMCATLHVSWPTMNHAYYFSYLLGRDFVQPSESRMTSGARSNHTISPLPPHVLLCVLPLSSCCFIVVKQATISLADIGMFIGITTLSKPYKWLSTL